MSKEIQQFKKRIEDWSGFDIELDENSSQNEWISKINELEDQLTNEITDMARKYERQAKELIPEEE